MRAAYPYGVKHVEHSLSRYKLCRTLQFAFSYLFCCDLVRHDNQAMRYIHKCNSTHVVRYD